MIICFSGYKRSGKDTLAAYLVKNYNAIQLSFANPLKDQCAAEYRVQRSYFDDQDKKEQPLLGYPVQPKDAFAAMLAEFMMKELRTGSGEKILGWDKDGEEWLALAPGDRGELIRTTAYHTPRSLAILKGSTNRFVDRDWWIKMAFDQADAIFSRDPEQIVVVTDCRYKSEANQLLARFPDAKVIRIERFEDSPSSDPSERDMDDYPFEHYIDNRNSLDHAYDQLEVILRNSGVL